MVNKVTIEADAVDLAEKYFEDAHVTGEGYVYFNNGHYVYPRKYGYAIIHKHQKVVHKCSNLKELEEYFQSVAVATPPKAKTGKKSTQSVKDFKTTTKGVVRWKGDTKKVTSHKPTKDENWKGQVQRAEDFGISNINEFGRKQAGYILHIADPDLQKAVNKKKNDKNYCQNKLVEMGVQFGTPVSKPETQKDDLEAKVTAMVKNILTQMNGNN